MAVANGFDIKKVKKKTLDNINNLFNKSYVTFYSL